MRTSKNITLPALGILLLGILLLVVLGLGAALTPSRAEAQVEAARKARREVRSGAWGDQGNGTFINPVLNADYSDPDVCRVEDKYYMVASEFQYMGMPLLESTDMVNWKIVARIYTRLDFPAYDTVASYSNGSWAPAIRYHDGRFYVYFCTIPEGLFLYTAVKPEGPWTGGLIHAVRKWEDPCPFWDDDGQAYLGHSVHGAGPIIIHKMSPDGRRLLDDGVTVYTGPVAEGTKIFKRDGWYYLSIPEGGVASGWQTVLRSRSIYGPYEKKVVLETGRTDVNGPHQGALVDTPEGEWWFYHFQQAGPLGRVVHLQPAYWADGWPVIGVDMDRNSIGEPVYVWKKPAVAQSMANGGAQAPVTDDDFNAPTLGLQWQWNHNPDDAAWSLTNRPGYLSLRALPGESLLRAKNTLTQKAMGWRGEVVVALDSSQMADGQKAGLCLFGSLYNMIGVYRDAGRNYLFFESNADLFNQPPPAATGGPRPRVNYFDASKNTLEKQPLAASVVYLKLRLDFIANKNQFFYSLDNKTFTPLGRDFSALFSFWKGARPALFSYNERGHGGMALFDWFHYDHDGPSYKD